MTVMYLGMLDMVKMTYWSSSELGRTLNIATQDGL